MKLVVRPQGRFLHYEITDKYLYNRLRDVLSLRELPVTVSYPLSKYSPIGKYDVFTVTLEVSHEGIKTPLMLGTKTFTSPFIAPLIDDFNDYLYVIADIAADEDRWSKYSEFEYDGENLLEKGFSFDYIEGVLPPTLFKYEKKYFENLEKIYANTLMFTGILSSSSGVHDNYFEELSKNVISLETYVFVEKERGPDPGSVDIVYDFPRFTIPVSIGAWIIYFTLGYEDYGRKIRQMCRVSTQVYAPIDFEVMLYNFKKVEKNVLKVRDIIKQAPDFYNPIKEKALKLVDEYVGYYSTLVDVAREEKSLNRFREDRIIESNFEEYLQPTRDGYDVVVRCRDVSCKEAIEKAREFEKIMEEASSRAHAYAFF